MKTKSSAHYQREYRKRLREQGLIKKEVWIRPQNTRLLTSIEKKLRTHDAVTSSDALLNEQTGVIYMSKTLESWTTNSLFDALGNADTFKAKGSNASIELIDGIDPTIHIIMHDYGDLPVFLTVSGDQIIVEAVLWAASEINDISNFNETILRTHKFFPLSTISLDTMSDGSDYYHMFGALSSTSIIENVVFEIEVLASNVIQATSAYGGFLNKPIEA